LLGKGSRRKNRDYNKKEVFNFHNKDVEKKFYECKELFFIVNQQMFAIPVF
jgi:hypothetical protein